MPPSTTGALADVVAQTTAYNDSQIHSSFVGGANNVDHIALSVWVPVQTVVDIGENFAQVKLMTLKKMK